MSFSDGFIRAFRALLPAPFTIAVLLTLVTAGLAFGLTRPDGTGSGAHAFHILEWWEGGLWNPGLLVFALQMMLMLVLGHVLALSRPIQGFIQWVVRFAPDTPRAAALVTLLTVLVGLFNWGLALIFGAVMARQVGEHAARNGIPLNYPLIGAAGYTGLLVWHGGLSGSSLAKVAEPGHLRELMALGDPNRDWSYLPERISFAETVFSPLNGVVSLALIMVLPLAMFWLGKRVRSEKFQLPGRPRVIDVKGALSGAEKLDHTPWLSVFFGQVILCLALYRMFGEGLTGFLNFFVPNNINFLLLGLAILLHGNFANFLGAVDEAIAGASGILIQFPLYFGIMGIMRSSGLVDQFSAFFVAIASENTYPIFTFFSAGLVNLFVPSGGGQWAVQGPIIVQAAGDLGLSLPKSIMALAYGDQLTNMLQPFWALPLLGITGLKARDILPYTLFLFLVGGAIFLLGLVLF